MGTQDLLCNVYLGSGTQAFSEIDQSHSSVAFDCLIVEIGEKCGMNEYMSLGIELRLYYDCLI